MLEPSMRENHADERLREGREVRMIRIGKIVQEATRYCEGSCGHVRHSHTIASG
jgi:hypothetical protein